MLETTSFTIATNKIKYLGLNLTKKKNEEMLQHY